MLVFVPGAMLFSATAWAMPGNPGPESTTMKTNSGFPVIGHAATPERETGATGVEVRHDDISFRDRDCRQDVTGEARAGNVTSGGDCIESSGTRKRFSVQFGRRIGTRDDILGEFDGVSANYRLGEGLNLNGIAGYSAPGAEDGLNTDRQVFGLSATTDLSAQAWDLNGFVIEQKENGTVTGRSMGGAIRHLQPGRSYLFYTDFDVAGDSLGTLLASGAWNLGHETAVRATLDLHRRPIPVRQQKYLQQSMSVTQGWDWNVPTERLAYYTGNGSREVSILNVGLSRILTQRINLSGDVVMLDAASGPEAAANPRSREYFYHLKLGGKDLILPGARSKLDLRHAVTGDGRTDSAIFDTRYTIGRSWNLVSQLRADYHRPVLESRSWWEASPNLKMEYQRSEKAGFQIAAGGNLSNGGDSGTDAGRASCYVSLAYSAKF